jgi:RimJ/RimL family protein N-acetyltransferase
MKLINVTKENMEFIYRVRSHPEVDKYLLGAPPANLREHGKFMGQNMGRFRILWDDIFGKIGYAQIRQLKPNMAEIGFCLHPDFQGKGFGVTLVELTIKEAKKANDFIVLFVHEDNSRAIKLYNKLGFKKVENRNEVDFMILSKD